MSDIENGLQNAEIPVIVDQEQFTKEIQKYYSGHNENSKKLEWTSERIQSVIKLLDDYNTAKCLGKRPTNKQYHHANKYSCMNIGNQKILIMKRKNISDPVVQIIPTEEYYQRILDAHITTSHGRRDKLVVALRDKYVVPRFAITIFINLCKTCLSKKNLPKTGTVEKPLSSDDSNRRGQENCPQSENEIKVFCPKCDSEVWHTAEGIQADQTKILIAKVYHYFEREYEELKTIYGDLDLTPLSKFGQRTALATGVSEMTVLQILKEEERRNAVKRQEPPEKQRSARKRSIQTDRAQTVVVKVEPLEYYNEEPEIYVPVAVKVEPSDIEHDKEPAQTDPIGVDVKTEPRSDVVDNTNETLALNEPAGTKRKARKIPRSDVTATRTNETLALNEPAGTKRRARKIPRSDVTATRQHTQGESSTAAAASSVRLTEELDESSLFGDTEIKVEEIEIHEEGVR